MATTTTVSSIDTLEAPIVVMGIEVNGGEENVALVKKVRREIFPRCSAIGHSCITITLKYIAVTEI